MAIRGLSRDGIYQLIRSKGSVRTGTLIYMHGSVEHQPPAYEVRHKLSEFLTNRGHLILRELAEDKNVIGILIEDDEKLAKRVSKLLALDFAIENGDIGFKMYEIRNYAITDYNVQGK